MTIKFVLKVIERKKDFSNTYKEIIYESLFMIYLSFHFASYYERKKQFEKKNEDKDGSNAFGSPEDLDRYRHGGGRRM